MQPTTHALLLPWNKSAALHEVTEAIPAADPLENSPGKTSALQIQQPEKCPSTLQVTIDRKTRTRHRWKCPLPVIGYLNPLTQKKYSIPGKSLPDWSTLLIILI